MHGFWPFSQSQAGFETHVPPMNQQTLFILGFTRFTWQDAKVRQAALSDRGMVRSRSF